MSFCKTLTPEARKEIASEISEEHDISITRACKLMGIHKSFFYYESTKDDSEVEAAIRQKAEVTNEGFWKKYRLIRKDGHPTKSRSFHTGISPDSIHGGKFISHEFQEWCEGNGIKIMYT